ncbi:sensor histidine kinase [Streptacidiphilus sp. EB103A]|uniref:sensor histidine kinase n=1 Tax=Streptacidiphilus sp. EB103A TaxID=3156275 RepID=UPI003510E59B
MTHRLNARTDQQLDVARTYLLSGVSAGRRFDDRSMPPNGLVQVVDAEGRVIQRGAGATVREARLVLSLAQLRADAVAGRPVTVGPSAMRTLVTPLPAGRYLVTAQSTADTAAAVQSLVTSDAVTDVPMIVIVVVGTVWFSRRTLEPMGAMTRTARRITEGHLSHRVEVARSPLEAARLAEAFNTMLQRIEEELTRRKQAEEQLRDFVNVAGHELRTPLTSIAAYTQLMRFGAIEDPRKLDGALVRVQHETRRMTSLVDELLLLARLDQHRPLERRRVDLAQLCSEAVADARVRAPDRELRCEVDPGGHVVEGDPYRLRQVVTNLLANIAAHTPPGVAARVHVRRDGDTCLVDVVDQGPGIPEQLRERVFERFFRARPMGGQAADSGSGATGSGLGLSIVAAVVTAHDGTVRIVPTDQGTWFQVRLPVGQSAPDPSGDRGALMS